MDPAVATLLEVDREYRDKAAAGQLQRIAPRRFNPEREAWLPVLHARRDGRHFTALFCTDQRVHEQLRDAGVVPVVRDDDAELAARAAGVGDVARVADEVRLAVDGGLAHEGHVPVVVDAGEEVHQVRRYRARVLHEAAPAPVGLRR